MKKCVLCGKPLDDSNPDEHIIHNALGGVLKDNGIYCETCNSNYGTCLDKEFTKIFDPIMAGVNMHKDRKTAGSPFFGVVRGEDGKLYRAKYKGGRITALFDDENHYVNPANVRCVHLFYEFSLDNTAFKLGLAKIAFNYAIHQNFDPSQLERVFDHNKREIVSHPVIIPFIPLTLFDAAMERKPPEALFHAVRIFNYGPQLYAYVELFATFQHYILLSERYDYQKLGNVDCSDGNLIEQKEMPDADFLEAVTPDDFKDAIVITQQYGLDLKNFMLKEQVDGIDCRHRIGKTACEKVRKKPYLVSYADLVERQYEIADFHDIVPESPLFDSLIIYGSHSAEVENPLGIAGQFYSDYQFYTNYETNSVEMCRYKRLMPDRTCYPWRICETLSKGQDVSAYGYMKFQNLPDNRTS